ncbi:hypothetical protein A2691_02265 [Candidatus Woesebacteria bacterium RIFCSPHIGHO2_01_FULL_39_23]|uniref:LytR/CpsA/Psr regulator C-terminal domain-containing protein n=1 Tax=candidate division WWE3 bacterium RIFCSPLOWO2_01_FULL_37_15 TaxID=1802622 RepID=A0A1F4UXK9_UNCKA|nr:MAG: hypothetical protein A3A69_00135 [candidate division WWE3 bacterium RIFCSPLOWO2_01_FULL_37_15]OGM22675.1 MAG: hypothetical protein A2691_02265 [Candidatus Woesebacteria bacterium RIFCSPHIGHO2_01_FULL_39_23]
MEKEKLKRKSKRHVKAIVEETVPLESAVETSEQPHGIIGEEVKKEEIREAEKEQGKNVLKLFTIAFLSMIFVAIVTGGVYTYLSGVSLSKNEIKITPVLTPTPPGTPEPSAAPETTPEATKKPDITPYKVNVLNGSGKIGVASQIKTDLATGGFKKITTNNANSFDYQETLVSAKENVPETVTNLIKEILSKKYTVADGESLKESSSFDIEIILGLK